MPTYITLMKLTEQGVKSIKDAPKRVEAARKVIEGAGGKMPNFYLAMGEYDYVAITEFASDETAAAFVLGLGARGNVRTTTLRAFTEEEFAAMVKKLT